MIEISDKAKCCGCTACANICPQQCITMESDEEGFVYPSVALEKCINCNLCEKVCPVTHRTEGVEVEQAFIVRNKNCDIVKTSSSGGFFSALCEYVIREHGVVFGAGFGENWEVRHVESHSLEDCKCFQGSKYVQSNLDHIFSMVKKYLMSGKLVCFSGTPCQTEGLANYLGKRYDNLILVDLVCHGVPSPKIWKLYLALMEKEYSSKIVYVNFRSKKYGYQGSSMHLKFENGAEYYGTARVDMMLKSFFSHISLRPICYQCPFKGSNRVSDFTIYDCWHAAQILHIKDDDMGFTSVLARGEKSLSIIKELNTLDVYERPVEQVIRPIKDGMLSKSASLNKNRDKFYKEVNQYGLRKVFNDHLFVSRKDYAIEKIKIFMSRIGLLHHFSRMRKLTRAMQEKRQQDNRG